MEGINRRKKKYLGENVVFLDVVDSTQEYAKSICNEAVSGTVVIADSQTQGRGRLNRSWSSAPGLGIWMSIILKPEVKITDFPKITLVASVALREVLELLSINAKIKWPNDLLINDKKVSGILTEVVNGSTVIVGCGINVNHTIEDLPEELHRKATSLKIACGKEFDKNEILVEFYETFEVYLELLRSEGFERIRTKWIEYTNSIGKVVRVEKPGVAIQGKINGIDCDGVLLVEDDNGVVHKVVAGDVIYAH